MTDEIMDRLDRFTADAELDLDALAGAARRRAVRRRALVGVGTAVAVTLGVVGVAQLQGPPPLEIGPLADDTGAVDDGQDGGDSTGVVSGADGPRNEADVELAAAPSPDDTSLQLLVTERACASGRTAEGRIQVISLDMTQTEVRFVLGVVPLAGGAMCPSNPATPFTLELPQPLGERTVVDASTSPARELTFRTGGTTTAGPLDVDTAMERLLSVAPPDRYEVSIEVLCFDCPGPQIHHVTFDDGTVTRSTPEDPGSTSDPMLAPALSELYEVVVMAWEAGIVESVSLRDDGLLQQVTFVETPDGVPDGVVGWALYDLVVG